MAKIVEEFDTDAAEAASVHTSKGPVELIAELYSADRNAQPPAITDKLLGFVLKISYDEVQVITCDPWKRSCGGVPRNSFVLIRLSPHRVSAEEQSFCNRLIMARITDSVPTPVEADITQTIYQIHKAQATIDPITAKELQWSALRGSVIGTFYDTPEKKIGFGLDVDTFFASHAYEVFVPRSDHLERLINCFSEDPDPIVIGELRYTETPSFAGEGDVPVRIDPSDIRGRTYGHRTALFGKTRFGKSNTMKVIADTILSRKDAGQIIFDPSGEYTYWNGQDGGCLAARYPDSCSRYSLRPRSTQEESDHGLQKPKSLLINFYAHPNVGHSLIASLWQSELGQKPPDYIAPTLNWECPPFGDAPDINSDPGGYKRFWRSMGLWFAILVKAGFTAPQNKTIPVDFQKNVKTALLNDNDVRHLLSTTDGNGGPELAKRQPISALCAIFEKVATLRKEYGETQGWFPKSKTSGESYFDATCDSLLKILEGSTGSGAMKFARFRQYHSVSGSDSFSDIVEDAHKGKTVFVDLSMGDLEVRKALAERICDKLLTSHMKLFSKNELSGIFTILYFEEAHSLFPRDDKSVSENIYNKLAKEGAKFNISMVYATQSMSSLSPDLLKNTENFIVTHLDDDREVRELEHKRAFRDIASDVERITTKGYVRMKTLSLPFALPVKIRKFVGTPAGGNILQN